MANSSQVVVLVGVFLVAILLSSFVYVAEPFANKKKKAKKTGAKKTGAKKSGAKKTGSKKASRGGKKASRGGKKASRGGKKASRGGKKASRGGKKASRGGKKASRGGKKASRGGRAATPRASTGRMSGPSSEVGVPARGHKFSELVQSLTSYKPGMTGGMGSAMGGAAATGGLSKAALNQIRGTIKKECRTTKDRARDNERLARRSTSPVIPGAPRVSSPSLNQGAFLQSQGGQPISVLIYPSDYLPAK